MNGVLSLLRLARGEEKVSEVLPASDGRVKRPVLGGGEHDLVPPPLREKKRWPTKVSHGGDVHTQRVAEESQLGTSSASRILIN